MGRPIQFDKAQALERAMEAFWARGFEATSLDDLCETMGIGRSSFYRTFGSKHDLLIAALDRYDQRAFNMITRELIKPRPVRHSVAAILNGFVDDMVAGPGRRGCLMGNCAAELAPRDPVASARVKQSFAQVERAFREGLARAMAAGDTSIAGDVDALARFLTSTVQGLRLIGKANPDRDVLEDVVRVALRCLR